MKISVLTLCAAILAAPFGDTARAQEPDFDCTNPEAQQELNYCSYQDFLKADKQLNAVYRKAVASQVATDKYLAENYPKNVGAVKALKKAQRAWIDYRDGHCDGVGLDVQGGSIQPLVVNTCLTEITRNRIKELNALIQGIGAE
jgi:uncharacterized protein YecT (DUF1311 family)